ncbi:monooxygenase [Xylaria digitata]|nr:monooxygenase [Xylaria digitata]
MSDKWGTQGPTTFHGVFINGFPNLLLAGPIQAGVGANFADALAALASHAARVVAEAVKRAGDAADRVVIEPTIEAEESWSMQCLSGAAWFTGLSVCTPSYISGEGKVRSQEEMMKMARGSIYSQGLNAFKELLEEWRADGKMEGMIVATS